jgi:hypothetical protein
VVLANRQVAIVGNRKTSCMPHADTARSFGAAVRHLFRHLDDLAALRQNPLARAIFNLDDPRAAASDVSQLATIRSIVLEGGRVCYAEDIAGGRVRSARRYFAILSGLCARHRAREIALELNVSLPQLYRDRRAICERVARLLLARPNAMDAAAHVTDALRFGLWRVAALAEQGFPGRAIAECERIVAESTGLTAKALTLLKLGDAALRLGDAQRAADATCAARQIMTNTPAAETDELELAARLVEFRLAMHHGRHQDASRIIEALATVARTQRGEPRNRTDVHVDILLDASRFAAYDGRLDDANAAVTRAADIVLRGQGAPPAQRVEIAVLRASFAQDGSVDPGSRFVRLHEARSLAYALGSAIGVLFASIGLAYQCLALRDEKQSRSYADQALHVAGSMEGRQSLLFTIASLAPALLHLRRWDHLDPLIFDIESAAVPMTDLWTNLKLTQGALLARRGRNRESLAPLSCAVQGARALQKPRAQAMALREFALSLYACGRAVDARDCIRAAIRFAESGDDVLELRRTYRAASRILREPRRSRLAMETGS